VAAVQHVEELRVMRARHAADAVDVGGDDRVPPAGLAFQVGEFLVVPGGGPGASGDQS
jgi:hypothetical protein